MRTSDLDYVLPPGRIATHPAHPRDHSRLMVVHRRTNAVDHRRFHELPDLLSATDLLVLNDTKVLAARLLFKKTTGAAIPGLFVRECAPGRWEVMLRSRGKLSPGDMLHVDHPGFTCRVVERAGERGHWIIDIAPALAADVILEKIGHVPLPPYIDKARQGEQTGPGIAETRDRDEYQTVYARDPGSLAAPTAGLHFTPDLLERLAARGIGRTQVTLHVGLGTFLPVETDTLEAHKMHEESYIVPRSAICALRAQRARHGRIVAVGTTAARTLESAAERIMSGDIPSEDLAGSTKLCIAPGHVFQLVDILLTNFHLPRSTLLALVAAMVGLERMHALYALAIKEGYRFYSYGDAMLILP